MGRAIDKVPMAPKEHCLQALALPFSSQKPGISHATSLDFTFFICNVTGLLDMSVDFTLIFDSAVCPIAKYILGFHLTCK